MSLIEKLAANLAPGEPATPAEGQRAAAVAVILHDGGEGTRVLLMKRAERIGDPWSGHISLPGGRYDARDPNLLATAIRETHEEVGVDLTGVRLLGPLQPLQPFKSGPAGVQVHPYVFAIDREVTPVCGPEALAAFWLPLVTAAAGTFNGTYIYPGTTQEFPAWNYEGYVIWGLTWRILGDLLAACAPDATASPVS